MAGLGKAFPGLSPREENGVAIATLQRRTVRVYEVYWADLLEGDPVVGSFEPFQAQSLAWYPWLNRKADLYRKRQTLRVWAWTIILAPVALCAQATRLVIAPVFRALTRRSLHRVLDATAADVTNYAASVGRAAPDESPLGLVADDILGRFDVALRRAQADGCEEIQVVAHSLGTVIAYHALIGYLDQPNVSRQRPGRSLVRRLYTIGSPLERIRFIWPTLVREIPLGTEGNSQPPRLQWDNFHDRLDLISSALRHREAWGEVTNHGVFGRGGLARAHLIYQADPSFLRIVGQALFGVRSAARLSFTRRIALALLSLLETVVLVVLLLVPLAAALLISALVTLGVAAFLTVSSFFGEEAYYALQLGFDTVFLISLWMVVTMFTVGITLGPIAYGRYVAAYSHYAYRFHRLPSASPVTLPLGTWECLPAPLQRVIKAHLTVLALGVGFALSLFFWSAEGGELPWDPSLSLGWQIAIWILLAFTSVCFAGGLAATVGLVAYHIPGTIRRYRNWVSNTMRPPPGWVPPGQEF